VAKRAAKGCEGVRLDRRGQSRQGMIRAALGYHIEAKAVVAAGESVGLVWFVDFVKS